MRVLLLSEGNTDVRPGLHNIARGALAVLLEKVLCHPMKLDPSAFRIEGGRLPRLQRGGGFERKVKSAIELHDGKVDCLVVVVDRGGPTNKDRIQLLQNGRSQCAVALTHKTAIGVAVEELEAWLLADTAALSAVLNVTGASGEPEDLPDPKRVLDDLAADCDLTVADRYDRLARMADISRITSRCRAFEDFVRDIRERIAHN